METHPYKPFVPEGATKLVLGSIPPWRFTIDDSPAENRCKKLFEGDIDFYYGSRSNRFWRIISESFNSAELVSVTKIKALLEHRKIAMSDVVYRCRRSPARSALDQDLEKIEFNHELITLLSRNRTISTILFTSSFVERIFYRSVSATAARDLSGKAVILPDDGRKIRTVVLYSPSNMALRGIRFNQTFKLRKSQNPELTEDDFRTDIYRKYFME